MDMILKILLIENMYDDLYQLAIDTAESKKSKEEIANFFKELVNRNATE